MVKFERKKNTWVCVLFWMGSTILKKVARGKYWISVGNSIICQGFRIHFENMGFNVRVISKRISTCISRLSLIGSYVHPSNLGFHRSSGNTYAIGLFNSSLGWCVKLYGRRWMLEPNNDRHPKNNNNIGTPTK